MGRLYIRECQWPIDIEYMHIVHIRTNEISLSYGHIRLTKKRKKSGRKKALCSLFINGCWSNTEREREKKKYLLDIRPIILIFSLLLLVLGVGAAAAVLGSSVWADWSISKMYRSSPYLWTCSFIHHHLR